MNHARARRRLLIASHSHPTISNGGAEIAAWRHFEGVSENPEWQAWFVGCVREQAGRDGSAITQPFGAQEFLYSVSRFDWFKFANPDKSYPREFAELLGEVAPDILHFHHYAHFGVETFLHVRRWLPECRIVLTLHEFQAICNHYGQMVTRARKALCYGASPRDCNNCFPEFSRTDFFLRREFILRFFALVDHFISPSRFLAERYVEWGIDRDRISVIENVTAPASPGAMPRDPAPGGVLRVAFFGQISFLKGIHVLLDAAAILEAAGCTGIRFDIHGDTASQPAEFQTDFLERLARAGRNVQYHGAYDNARVDGLMRHADLALVPSIWWENSPVVIQECMRNHLPMLCSNIGGMAEKVRPGIDGWHFPVGSAAALAAQLRDIAAHPEALAAIGHGMRRPEAPQETIAAHLALYNRLLSEPALQG